MESSSLLLCKGLLLTGEASLGVVWGGLWQEGTLGADSASG